MMDLLPPTVIFIFCVVMMTNQNVTSNRRLESTIFRRELPTQVQSNGDRNSMSIEPDQNEDSAQKIPVTQQLEAMISKHPYKLSIRPKNEGKPIKVGVFLLIESITDISEKNMDLTFTLQMHQTWKDKRLRFESTLSDSSVVLPSRLISKLWVPDLYIVGSKHSFVHRTMVENVVMRLFSNGEIYYSVKITTTVACQMDLKTFPLDTENCYLTLQSLGYNVDELILEWVVGEHSNDLFMETGLVRNMPKFTLIHHNYHSFNSSASDMPKFTGLKSRLQISFELKRYFLAVFFQSYFPALSMVFLAGMSMWIDPKSVPARVAMGVTSVLTISTIITGLKASLPKVSYLTALDIYLWVCFLFVFSTVLEYCILNFMMTKKAAIKEKTMHKETQKLHLEILKEAKNVANFRNNKQAGESNGLIFRPISNVKKTEVENDDEKKDKRNDEPGAIKQTNEENDFCCLPANLCEKIKFPSCILKSPPIIDSYFRAFYFLGFLGFNTIYWLGYYYATQHDSDEE